MKIYNYDILICSFGALFVAKVTPHTKTHHMNAKPNVNTVFFKNECTHNCMHNAVKKKWNSRRERENENEKEKEKT